MPSTLAQSKERKGSNFAIWQHWSNIHRTDLDPLDLLVDGRGGGGSVDRGAVLAVDLDEGVAVVLQVGGVE